MNDPTAERSMEAELAAQGTTVVLETIGRRSHVPRRVTIGFVEDGEDLLVAASSEATHWARNLALEPSCYVELRGLRTQRVALALSGPDAEAVVVALILKYGTPAERLGAGPVFRLIAA